MKKFVLIIIAAIAVLASCNDYETYGDKKEKERNAISKFIADSSITVISEDQFVQSGYKTDLSRNEYVRLDKSGVYMQIVRLGCGDVIKDGETVDIICRFREYNILEDVTTAFNDKSYMVACPDIIHTVRNSGTITGVFTKSAAMYVNSTNIGNMYYTYGSASVPPGWLVPLTYIKIGVPQSETEEIAKVKLIVPHTQGHTTASGNVTPYFYTITFQRES